MKIFRVQFRKSAPRVIAPPNDPKAYYSGKIDHIAITLEPSDELEQELRRISEAGVNNKWIYPSSHDFVRYALQDSRAVVFKLSCLSSPSANMMTLSLHALDLDADLEKPEKESLRQFIYDRRGACTVLELAQRFDGFRKCWKDAQALMEGARRNGKRAELISSGCKGFRMFLFDDSDDLFVQVPRSTIKKSESNVHQVVWPVFQRFFGMDLNDIILDSSIYGENKGVRTSLSFHAATGIWPALIHSENDQYGHSQPHGPTQQFIVDFWTNLIDKFPVAQEVDEEIISPKTIEKESRKRPLEKRSSSADVVAKRRTDSSTGEQRKSVSAKRKVTLRQCTGFASVSDDEKESDALFSDDFDDVIALCDAQGWLIQQSSFVDIVPGQAVVYGFIDKGRSKNPFVCPKIGRVHMSNTWMVAVDRVTGDIRVSCGDHECKDDDFEWPVIHTEGSLGSDALFAQILADPWLEDHIDLITLLTDRLRQKISCDADGNWRFYYHETGTWHLQTSIAAVYVMVRDVLKEYLNELIARIAQVAGAHVGHTARLCNAAKGLLENLVLHTGSTTFVQKLGYAVTPFVSVPKEEWNKNFKDHLPVKGALLHFMQDGRVIAKPYAPELYVRHEFQANIEWCPDAPVHEGLEEILHQWWDDELRRSFLQFFAYSLSRSTFENYFFWIYGPAGSGKSSVLGMCAKWFGPKNIASMPDAGILVQNGKTYDNSGTGHNSTLIHAYEKALVVFSEPPNGSKCVLRDGDFKRMTGSSQQAGRLAYSSSVNSWERTFTMCMDTNRLIPPQDPSDEAIWRRIKVIKTNRVFFSDESHKVRMAEKMTEGNGEIVMIQADTSVVDRVTNDPKAAIYFLHLMIGAWGDLMGPCKRRFYETKESKEVLKSFISGMEEEKDSVTAFCKTQVKRNSLAQIAKSDLFAAYAFWWDKNNQTESLGPKVDAIQLFQTRVQEYFAHPPLKTARVTTRMWEKNTEKDVMVHSNKRQKARCWEGLQLVGSLFIDE